MIGRGNGIKKPIGKGIYRFTLRPRSGDICLIFLGRERDISTHRVSFLYFLFIVGYTYVYWPLAGLAFSIHTVEIGTTMDAIITPIRAISASSLMY